MRQTSLLAYQSVENKLGERQKLVLEALEEIAPATNKQIAEHLKWPINTVTPRCLELRDKGKVIQAFIDVDIGGRKATYWKPRTMKMEYGDVA